MTLYLALDTATERGSVAVGCPGSLASEVIVGARRHAAALVPSIEEALKLAGQSFADLTGILVANGPGSFTGLRIACATVQGVARQRPDLPVMTAPSLLSAARLASPFTSGSVAALFDALRGEVYAAVYRFLPGEVEILSPPALTTVRALRESGVKADVAVGDGAAAQADEVRAWTGREPVAPPEGGPRAVGLIELLGVRGAFQKLEDVAAWEPDYGRPAEAQVRWERMHGKPLPRSGWRRAADIPAVSTIERAVFADPWPVSAFRELLGRYSLVAVSNGEVTGYVFARAAADEGEVLNLAVRQDLRGQGLGRELLDTVFHQFRKDGVLTVYLEVRMSNAAGRAFYDRLGFREVGRRRAYYNKPREDALILVRELTPSGQSA